MLNNYRNKLQYIQVIEYYLAQKEYVKRDTHSDGSPNSLCWMRELHKRVILFPILFRPIFIRYNIYSLFTFMKAQDR